MAALREYADLEASWDPKPSIHFWLACYAGAGRTVPSPFEGWATFERIFQARPDGLRFAIVRALEVVMEHGAVVNQLATRWICWDLYDQGLLDRAARGKLRRPAPIWIGPTEDALIMRAVHHG
jgi:hypothetical protein